ncbi:TPA: class I SAM-dependent methyltransferase [Citrobacter freundii]
MIDSGKFSSYYGVDLYGDIHDTNEYKETLKYVGLRNNYKLLRMSFDDALDIFDDEFFDFIYIDGFAHTGEEGGKSIADWFCKLKIGGVLAGDDYHADWPLVVWAVNDFVKKTGLQLTVTRSVESQKYCQYPTWFVVKEQNIKIEPDETLMKVAMLEKERVHNNRMKRLGSI